MFLWKHIALKTTYKSGISIHAALPLLSEKTSSISLQIILPVYKAIKPFPRFLIGQLETRRVKLLRTKRITYVERIPHVLITIPSTALGTVASARRVILGTRTSKMVAKVFNLLIIYNNFSRNN